VADQAANEPGACNLFLPTMLLFVPFIGIYLSIRAVIFLFAYFRR
jgi:hypothetical protein